MEGSNQIQFINKTQSPNVSTENPRRIRFLVAVVGGNVKREFLNIFTLCLIVLFAIWPAANATATGTGAVPSAPFAVCLSSPFTASTISSTASTAPSAVLTQPLTEVPLRITSVRLQSPFNTSRGVYFPPTSSGVGNCPGTGHRDAEVLLCICSAGTSLCPAHTLSHPSAVTCINLGLPPGHISLSEQSSVL